MDSLEHYSVLRTPAYPKYHGVLANPSYSDRYGYTLAYYEPLYDLDLKIPGLGIGTLPFVPVQHVRASRGTRPFVPRHLSQEDMIQINLRADRKAKDIMKDFHPAQKASYESARDFRTRKEIESRIEDIRESCANVHDYCRKTDKYDFTRSQLASVKPRRRYEVKDRINDFVLESHIEHANDLRKKLGEDKDNHRAKFTALAEAARPDGKNQDVEGNGEENNETAADEPETSKSNRRTSRDVREKQLLALQERIKKQETEADCFERTFGRYLSKLRGEVDELTHTTNTFIGDTNYRFNI